MKRKLELDSMQCYSDGFKTPNKTKKRRLSVATSPRGKYEMNKFVWDSVLLMLLFTILVLFDVPSILQM